MILIEIWERAINAWQRWVLGRPSASSSAQEINASMIAILFGLGAFAFELGSPTIGVDDYLHLVMGFSWDEFWIGRGMWGGLVLHGLTPGPWITPTITLLTGILINTIVAITVGWAFQLRDVGTITLGLLYGLIVIFPYFAAQMAFSYLQIAYPLASLLVATGALIALEQRARVGRTMLGAVLVAVGFSIYQGSLSVLATIAILAPLFRSWHRPPTGRVRAVVGDYLRLLLVSVGGGLLFMTAHRLIISLTGVVPQSSFYSVSLQLDFWNRLDELSREFLYLFLGAGNVLPTSAMIIFLLTALALLARTWYAYGYRALAPVAALCCLAVLAPFAVLFLHEGWLAPRSTVGLSVIWLALFAAALLPQFGLPRQPVQAALVAVLVVFVFHVNHMFHSQYSVSKADALMMARLAERIETSAEQHQSPKVSVYVVGSYTHPPLAGRGRFYGSALGFSNFEWGNGNIYRMAALAKALGIDNFTWLKIENHPDAASIRGSLTHRQAWPSSEAVFSTQEGVVVWLGERQWDGKRWPSLLGG